MTERFKPLFSVGLGQDRSLQLLRILWGVMFILSGAEMAAKPHWSPSNDAFFRKTPFWDWYQGPLWIPGLTMLLLGVMVLDWLIFRTFCQDLLRKSNLKSLRKLLIEGVRNVLIAGVMLLLVLRGLKGFVTTWGGEMLTHVWGGLIGIFIAISVLRKVGSGIHSYIRDRRTFAHIVVTTRMTRQDITAAIDSFLTTRWRLAFVYQLAQQKVMATGNWPPSFQLSVSADPVLTELAKLEERWLKLDR